MNHTDHYNTWHSYPKDQSGLAETDAWLAKHGNGQDRIDAKRQASRYSPGITLAQRNAKRKTKPTKLNGAKKIPQRRTVG